MIQFLTIYSSYKDVEIGLFNDKNLIDSIQEPNKSVSKNIFILIDNLLIKNKINLTNLDFIAASQGPAPFTTLRVSLASVNGLAFACNIPLIGVNALKVLLSNKISHNYLYTVALLNAFCNDAYYGIKNNNNHEITIGCANIDILAQELKRHVSDNNPIEFIGSGVDLYKDTLQTILKNQAFIADNKPLQASLYDIGINAYNLWNKEKFMLYKLAPLYLKDQRSAQITLV